jgi:ferredoxin like protein
MESIRMIVEDIFNLVKYDIDDRAHITVDTKKCASCNHRACVTCCPAGCYTWEAEKLNFAFEACLECGSCYIICDKKAVEWNYPRGNYGVCFRLT